MTVSELIHKLKEMPQDAQLYQMEESCLRPVVNINIPINLYKVRFPQFGRYWSKNLCDDTGEEIIDTIPNVVLIELGQEL